MKKINETTLSRFPFLLVDKFNVSKKISIITIIISVTSIIITSCMKELIFWKSMLYMINDGLSTFSQKILGTHNSDFQSVNVKMLRLTIEFFLGQLILRQLWNAATPPYCTSKIPTTVNTKYSFAITSMRIEIYEQLQILSLNNVRWRHTRKW